MRRRIITGRDIPKRTQEYFWQHMTTPEHGCWIWQGAMFRRGYGNFHVPELGNIGAHIVAFLIAHPEVFLEPRECVLHTCDNPPCCRYDHLFRGTRRDNTHDMIKKGRENYYGNLKGARIVRGEEKFNHKLTDVNVLQIRKARAAGIGQKRLAKQYGVRYQTIQALDHGRTWKHVPTPLGAEAEKKGEPNVNPGDSQAGTESGSQTGSASSATVTPSGVHPNQPD